MVSMDVFCSGHKRLSKFGGTKEGFVFSWGGCIDSRHWQQCLHRRWRDVFASQCFTKPVSKKDIWLFFFFFHLFIFWVVAHKKFRKRFTLFPANCAFSAEKKNRFTWVHFDQLPPRSSSSVHVWSVPHLRKQAQKWKGLIRD